MFLWNTEAMAHSRGFGELPPPPNMVAPPEEQQLLLELVVNSMVTGMIVPVTESSGRLKVHTEDLRRAGINLQRAEPTVFIDELADISGRYDVPRQRLYLTVASSYLPAQTLNSRAMRRGSAAQSIGAVLNYDIFSTYSEEGSVQASLWHEARIFGLQGSVSTTGAARVGRGPRYMRFDTRWTRSDEERMTTLEVGDFITRGVGWSSAVRLGGVQFSRDFMVRPDVVTYPVPSFAGSAAVPSTVDLFINDYRVGGGGVNPGPFSVEALPPINGVGEANLVVTDPLGRSVSTTMPFYVSSALLRPGLTDYAAAIGAFRRGYGVRNFDYGSLAGTISTRHGITPFLTLEGHAELAEGLALAGTGAVLKIGTAGILSASYSLSDRDGNRGRQFAAGYEFQARRFSFGVRHSRQDADFADLGALDRPWSLGERKTYAATASASLGRLGSVGVSYINVGTGYGPGAKLVNASWSLPILSGTRLHLSVSHDIKQRKPAGALTFSLPLGARRSTMSAALARDATGRRTWQVDYARYVPSSGGVGVNASAFGRPGEAPYMRGEVLARTRQAEFRGGFYGAGGMTGWLGMNGSLVVMDGALFASNRIADAFALVSTDGEANVPIRFENQLVGHTDSKGHLLVPWVSAFYPAKYEIDPLSLPSGVRTPIVSQRLAIARGSGAVVTFPIRRTTAVRAILVDREGAVVPAGAGAIINGIEQNPVGWDGLLFLEDAQEDNHIRIELPDGGTCESELRVTGSHDQILDAGILICH